MGHRDHQSENGTLPKQPHGFCTCSSVFRAHIVAVLYTLVRGYLNNQWKIPRTRTQARLRQTRDRFRITSSDNEVLHITFTNVILTHSRHGVLQDVQDAADSYSYLHSPLRHTFERILPAACKNSAEYLALNEPQRHISGILGNVIRKC